MPLHAIARFSGAFPEGDHGGNLVRPFPNPRGSRPYSKNLHAYWDDLLGDDDVVKTFDTLDQVVNDLVREYPRSHFGDAELKQLEIRARGARAADAARSTVHRDLAPDVTQFDTLPVAYESDGPEAGRDGGWPTPVTASPRSSRPWSTTSTIEPLVSLGDSPDIGSSRGRAVSRYEPGRSQTRLQASGRIGTRSTRRSAKTRLRRSLWLARLYADEDEPRSVAVALRGLGHDVLTVREAGKDGQRIPDHEVLAFAPTLATHSSSRERLRIRHPGRRVPS